MPHVNVLAVLVAALSSFLLGGLWYSNAMLGGAWRREAAGLAVGACIVATSFGINYQFANRTTRLRLIDGGYHTVQFALYRLILGCWR